jgi:3-hydroxyisobutyrate dehydrogenase
MPSFGAGTPLYMDTIAVLGAGGIMGRPIASNLAKAGFEVRAWNRTRERAEPLVDEGITVVDSAAEAAEGSDVLLTMLSDADAVVSSVEGILESGATWLQMSTIGIEGTERCVELADRRGIPLVDSPVLGTRQPAQKGELVVLASGPDAARERCEPFFEAIGQRTLWLGEAGQGTRLKLVVNSWLVAVLEGVAETIALAEGLGIDPQLFLDTISGGGLDIPYAHLKGKMMIERSFEPAFTLSLAAKDARLVAEAAESQGLDLPLPRTVAARLEQGVEAGHGDEDMAATYLTSAPERS